MVTGKYRIETFKPNIFLKRLSSNNNIGSSSKIVVDPKDKGPNKAYVCPLSHPAFDAVIITESVVIPNNFWQVSLVATK